MKNPTREEHCKNPAGPQNHLKMLLKSRNDALSIAFLFCVTLVVTNPMGDFPLNDDWAFGRTVKDVIEQGEFRPSEWQAMPLLTHALWGSLFCLPAGFSFSALRLSTLTLSLGGVLATYFLMREMCQSRWLAVLASLTLAFSPVYYALSHTFMSDVPYTAMTVMSLFFFVRNLKTDSDCALLLGALLAVAATLSRQIGVAVPLAFAAAFILKNGVTKRNLARAAMPPVVCMGALLGFQHWLSATGRMPAPYVAQNHLFFHALANPRTVLVLLKNAYLAALYLGLFLLPVLIFVFGAIRESHRKQIGRLFTFSAAATMMGAVTLAVLKPNNPLLTPNVGNILVESGIGPLLLRDAHELQLNVLALPASLWVAVTAASLMGAALLFTALGLSALHLAPKWRPGAIGSQDAAGAFLLLGAMIYLFPLLVSGFFDRYLIPAMPFLSAGLAGVLWAVPRTTTKACRFTAAALLCAFAYYAVCGTRDYLTWNRLRWVALRDLMENKHVKPEDIDGGFEFNGWYMYDPRYNVDPKKSWWWVRGDTYQIGFGSAPGCAVIKEYSYFQWLPPHRRTIVELRKNVPGTPTLP
jgi:4-amino-4-deoxy-L-arabinose transferase-like glycosyltransferase